MNYLLLSALVACTLNGSLPCCLGRARFVATIVMVVVAVVLALEALRTGTSGAVPIGQSLMPSSPRSRRGHGEHFGCR